MTNGLPQSKAVDLFNRLAELCLNDVEDAQRLLGEALSLSKQQPGDFMAKVVLAEALLFAGRRDEAVVQIHAAFTMRDISRYAVMDRLAMLLMFIADRERALALVEDFAFQPGVVDFGLNVDNTAKVAAWAADLELLERLVERDDRAGVGGTARSYSEVLTAFCAEDVILHQKVLIEAVRDVQIAVMFSWTCDASGTNVLINSILFDGSKIARRELEDKINAAVEYHLQDRVEGLIYNVVTAGQASSAPKLKLITGDLSA